MLAKLEGAEDALGFASGMSAISSTVLSFVSPGDRIVAVRHVYPDAFRLFGTFMKRMNVEVVYVDGRDEAAVEKAMPGAKLFYMESPTSWVMEAHDVGALAAIGKRHGAVTVIDNSGQALSSSSRSRSVSISSCIRRRNISAGTAMWSPAWLPVQRQ